MGLFKGLERLAKNTGKLAVKGAKAVNDKLDENDLKSVGGLAAAGVQALEKGKEAANAAKEAYDTTAREIKDKGVKGYTTDKAGQAKDAAINKAGEIKDKALEKAEDAAQTVKASQAAANGVAAKKEAPDNTVVIIPAEADKEGNITKFGSGVKVSKASLAKGQEGRAAIKELAAELKADLAENGTETTLEDVAAAAKEEHGPDTVVLNEIIASRQH